MGDNIHLFDRELEAAKPGDTVKDVVERFRSNHSVLLTAAFCVYLQERLPPSQRKEAVVEEGHYHHSCLRTFERERSRAEFAEARLMALEAAIRELGQKMDGINGQVYERLGRKTLGGAVRALIIKD